MLDFLTDYASEIFLGLLMVLLRLFGQKKSAEEIALKVQEKRHKRKKKLQKKISKQSAKMNEELQELEQIENNEEPKFRNYSLQDYFSELDQDFMEITDTLSEELIKEIRT